MKRQSVETQLQTSELRIQADMLAHGNDVEVLQGKVTQDGACGTPSEQNR